MGTTASRRVDRCVIDGQGRCARTRFRQVFDQKGSFLRSFGVRGKKDGFFHYPVGIAVNDENALFVCDQGNHRIQVLLFHLGAVACEVFNASDGPQLSLFWTSRLFSWLRQLHPQVGRLQEEEGWMTGCMLR